MLMMLRPRVRIRPRLAALALLLIAICLPPPVRAHDGQPIAPHDLWSAWNTDAWVILGLALPAAAFARGQARLAARGRQFAQRERGVGAALGFGALALALLSPLDALAGVLLSAHMIQHVLLMLMAAPLLAWAAPLGRVLLGLPLGLGRRLGAWWSRAPGARGLWRALTLPAVAWTLHALALWFWHIPAAYQAALRSPAIHALEHISFFGTALLFWWVLLRPATNHTAQSLVQGPGAALYVFTQALQSGLLGALMTLAPQAWYPAYGATAPLWGLTPLEDQQLAGGSMWIPSGLVYTLAALALVAAWFRRVEHQAEQGW
jgi:cytochrome c oxidase assembly factor CtaG